ncbi:MAG TPA: hypothetical protein VG889_07770 [Rhizomicrobium sp.]|nr:hypothetical protein [Rhizomicrobium sp.]
MPDDPVPGRDCGGCTVCCVALPIETAELRKLPGVACRHCGPKGCAIYETRYPVCRSYICGWRQLPELDDAWRPDRSGVLVSPMDAEGIEFLVLAGERAIRRDGFAQYVATCIVNGIATYLAVPGPIGHYPARVFLNDRLALAVAQRDLAAIRALLLSVLASAAKHTFRPMDRRDEDGL